MMLASSTLLHTYNWISLNVTIYYSPYISSKKLAGIVLKNCICLLNRLAVNVNIHCFIACRMVLNSVLGMLYNAHKLYAALCIEQ